MTRPSWDKYFLQICEVVATRSTCDRRKVGSVIVKDRQILSTGYNGSLPGAPHCDDPPEFWECIQCRKKYSIEEVKDDTTWPTTWSGIPECRNFTCRLGRGMVKKYGGHIIEGEHCKRSIHSEKNAIAQAAKYGVCLEGATLYCNTLPCLDCLTLIISAGIREVVYRDDYGDQKVKDLAKEINNFDLRQWEEKLE